MWMYVNVTVGVSDEEEKSINILLLTACSGICKSSSSIEGRGIGRKDLC